MGWVLLQTIGSLFAVLTLMVTVLFILKKWISGGQSSLQSFASIEVLAHRTLQPKKSIYVVEVLGKMLVVGVSESGIQLLTEIKSAIPSSPADLIETEEYRSSQVSKSFVDYLKDNLGIVRPKKK